MITSSSAQCLETRWRIITILYRKRTLPCPVRQLRSCMAASSSPCHSANGKISFPISTSWLHRTHHTGSLISLVWIASPRMIPSGNNLRRAKSIRLRVLPTPDSPFFPKPIHYPHPLAFGASPLSAIGYLEHPLAHSQAACVISFSGKIRGDISYETHHPCHCLDGNDSIA